MQPSLSEMSLDQAEAAWRQGLISEAELVAFIRQWNSGPRFCQAVLSDGAVRVFDPERSGWCYRHLRDEFGLQGVD